MKPELNPEDQTETFDASREFTRPLYTFKGKELWPFARKSKMILAQVFSDDVASYRALAFIFIHTRRGGKTFSEDLAKFVIPIAWKIDEFRAKIVDLAEDMSDEDIEEAARIFGESLTADRDTQFRAEADGDAKLAQKKNRGRSK